MLKKTDNQASRGEEGTSLVEIAVVVMIVATIIAISLPAIGNSIRAYNLRSAALRIAERVSGARTLAMAKNKNVTVSFATDGAGNVTQYGYDFGSPSPTPTIGTPPDGLPDSFDPDDPTQSYYFETPPSGITVRFLAGGDNPPLPNSKDIVYTSRGEMPIGAAQADIQLSNTSGSMIVSVNLRGQVWVH